jgi:D-3-phosphoglycerate dehydrogenase
LSPHVGGQTVEAARAISLAVAEAVLAALRGERPRDVVNPSVYVNGPGGERGGIP